MTATAPDVTAGAPDVDTISETVDALDTMDVLPPHRVIRECARRLLGRPAGLGVDVGCGSGSVVAELTARGVRAIGVDVSEAVVDVASRRFPHCDYRVADAADLPFDAGSLGWYRAEQVLQHSTDPAALLREARRVVAPGGRVLLADRDLDTWAMDADDGVMTRILVRGFAESVPNGRAGTRAVAMLLDAGFVDVQVQPVPIVYDNLDLVLAMFVRPAVDLAVGSGAASPHNVRAWLADQRRRSGTGRFLMTMSTFVTTAVAPL